MGSDQRPGFALPLLLLGAFRSVIDELHRALAEGGHSDARPLHGFALQAIGADGCTASELGRRLGVSKQAAAKTVASLDAVGYILREPDVHDGRAVRLVRTVRGDEMLALSAAFFDDYRARLLETFGADRVGQLEHDLEQIAGRSESDFRGFPGWLN